MKSKYFRKLAALMLAALFIVMFSTLCDTPTMRVIRQKPAATEPIQVAPGGPVPYPPDGGGNGLNINA
jgi:hypothetical protein